MYGNRIKELRKSYGYTQKQLADKIGVAGSTIGMYEQGRKKPNKKVREKIGYLFCVPVEFIFSEQEEDESDREEELIMELKKRISKRNGANVKFAP